ncbi:CpsD/CapB family tyrosine-protein kinase [Jeotgalibacillus soli]|nr:CpsD/CapB family tyrosine-protein kinase [Jeotgalibacillus soli]
MISDQFRTIKINIQFLTKEKKNRVFLITSPGKGEGKSTTTANLAVSMAQQKQKVLLIDANLRNPIIHSIFKVPNEIGLTNVLTGKTSFAETVCRTEIGKLEILTSGSISFNPAELLGNELMSDLLQRVVNSYDIVLIDSPSVLHYTETRVLANQCDGVVLVLHRERTELEHTAESRRVLDLAHAKLVGAIINESK